MVVLSEQAMPGYLHDPADATCTLQELEMPQWKLRRIVYDDPQWHCSSSKHSALPMELDVI